jgi:hypothetical protein
MFSKTTSQSLQKKSADILSVFRKTIDGLNEVVTKANAQSATNRAEAQVLLNEATELEAVAQSNIKVIGKIESLLND